jgi:hypothetical protein
MITNEDAADLLGGLDLGSTVAELDNLLETARVETSVSRSSGVSGLAGGGAVHHGCLPSLPDRVRRGARAIKPGGP